MKFTNEKYSIELDQLGAILSMESGGKQFVKSRLPLFAVQLRSGNNTQIITSDEARRIEFGITSATAETAENTVNIQYEFPNLIFDITLHLGERIEAGFSFENHTKQHVEWVDFCQYAVPNDLSACGGSGRIVMDINEGLLLEDIALKEQWAPYQYRPLEYPSEGLYSMFPAVIQSQFLSYYDDTAGIYMAAEDPERSIKGIDVAPLADAIKMQFRLYPGVTAQQEKFALPYRLVIDFFRGDWYEAAELYRKWFETALPENLRKAEQNDSLPEWYSDAPLVVTYPVQGIHDMDDSGPNRLFPYQNALPYLDEISKATNSRIMSLLMHWEGTAPWAPPYVWPPLGGSELLARFGKELHDRGFLLGVYCSGISYSVKSNINDFDRQKEYEEQNLSRYMCASPSGEIVSKICQSQRRSYDMCISQDFTKAVLWEEAEKMASCGLDYIQILDQNHGGTPYLCYSDQHGHPAVPGKWMVEHMTAFLKKLKDIVGDKVLLGCESAAAESYISYLNLSDNRFNLNGFVGKFIPLYGYIYHEYLQNFSGNSVCSMEIFDTKRSPESYLLRLAHSYLAGDLLTLVINQDGQIAWAWGERDFSFLPNKETVLQFVKSATAYKRGAGKKYLTFGKMIRPCRIECESVRMYKTDEERFTEYPKVLTTAWTADDGSRAQFLVNYCGSPEKCRIDLTGTKGAELIDEMGNVTETLAADVCELIVPACGIKMLRLQD